MKAYVIYVFLGPIETYRIHWYCSRDCRITGGTKLSLDFEKDNIRPTTELGLDDNWCDGTVCETCLQPLSRTGTPPGEIRLPCYDMCVTLGDEDLEAQDFGRSPKRYKGGKIYSNLETQPPDGKTWNSVEDYEHAGALNAIEAIVLAHAVAGIDITSPAYVEGIETAVEGCSNNL